MCHNFHSNGHVVSHDNHVFQSILGRKIVNPALVFIRQKLLTMSGLRHLKVLWGETSPQEDLMNAKGP